MKRIKILTLVLTLMSMRSFAIPPERLFLVDKEHTQVAFDIDHLVISSVAGRFDGLDGQIFTDTAGKITRIIGEVNADSINTGNAKRDKHLRSADFFESEKHKKITFIAVGVGLGPGEKKSVSAKVTLRGITKTIPFLISFKGKATDPWGTEKIVVDASAVINRKDFGLTWNEALETGGVMVGEEVRIQIKAQGNLK